MDREPKEADLRIWHEPQVPMKAFYASVDSLVEARKLLIILADYDLFQLEHNIKPDYCNMNGLEVFENGEWIEWEDANGDDIHCVNLDRPIEEASADTATAGNADANLTQKGSSDV